MFKWDLCTQAGCGAGSLDGNKQKNGQIKPEKFLYLIPFVSESKGEARVRAGVLR